MCKFKFKSEDVFVLAFGYARYAFRRRNNDYYQLPVSEAKKHIGHGAPSQKLLFTNNQTAHQLFKVAEKLKISDDGELIVAQNGSYSHGYLFNPAINKYEPVLKEPAIHCELHCGGNVIVLGLETYKTVLYRGQSNKLYVLSGHFSTAEVSAEDKIFVTDAANKSTIYYYDRGMKQVVILG